MDDFTFNGLEIEDSKSTFGRFILGAMVIVFTAASMATTFGFFATYAPGLGETFHQVYGGYIAGALGVLLFDLAGLGWTVLRARNSDTSRQFVIATIAAVVTIGLALFVSALQVVLSSSFDVGIYLADGRLSDFGRNLQVIGVITLTAGFVVDFAAIAAYVNTSADVTRAVQQTQLRAYVTGGRFAADKARAELVTRQTLEGIFRELPALAARAGRRNTAGYVGHNFGGLDTADIEDDEPETAVDLDTLIDELAEERVQQRLAHVSPNGQHGANFTRRPDGR